MDRWTDGLKDTFFCEVKFEISSFLCEPRLELLPVNSTRANTRALVQGMQMCKSSCRSVFARLCLAGRQPLQYIKAS